MIISITNWLAKYLYCLQNQVDFIKELVDCSTYLLRGLSFEGAMQGIFIKSQLSVHLASFRLDIHP